MGNYIYGVNLIKGSLYSPVYSINLLLCLFSAYSLNLEDEFAYYAYTCLRIIKGVYCNLPKRSLRTLASIIPSLHSQLLCTPNLVTSLHFQLLFFALPLPCSFFSHVVRKKTGSMWIKTRNEATYTPLFSKKPHHYWTVHPPIYVVLSNRE